MDTDYEKQATKFLKRTKSTMYIKYVRYGRYFDSDKDSRDVYEVTITRGSRKMTLTFGQSIVNTGLKVGGTLVDTSDWSPFLINYIYNGVIDYHLKDGTPDTVSYPKPTQQDIADIRYTIKKRIERQLGWGHAGIIIYPKPPTPYDVLACLQKYDVGTHKDFCAEYGYDVDSISGLRTYEACAKQYEDLCRVFTDEQVTMLQEIN